MDNLAERFQDAVQYFWTGRATALERQIETGNPDAGTRGAVTAGGHMARLALLVVDLLREAGLENVDIRVKAGLELPGYYRPEKKWDLLVVSKGRLVTAIEFKSQFGPSFGNNFNNRIEEALGNATDLWKAFEEGRLGPIQPFLGYFFLLEDTPRVHTKVGLKEPNFAVDQAFRDTSYAERYRLLCQRLVLQRLYSATCLTLATNETPTKVSHPTDDLSIAHFAALLQGHAKGVSMAN